MADRRRPLTATGRNSNSERKNMSIPLSFSGCLVMVGSCLLLSSLAPTLAFNPASSGYSSSSLSTSSLLPQSTKRQLQPRTSSTCRESWPRSSLVLLRSSRSSSSRRDEDDASGASAAGTTDFGRDDGYDGLGEYDPSEGLRPERETIVGNPQLRLKEKERSVTSILKELAAIQQQGPQKYCILGTRHCSYLHQQIIELLYVIIITIHGMPHHIRRTILWLAILSGGRILGVCMDVCVTAVIFASLPFSLPDRRTLYCLSVLSLTLELFLVKLFICCPFHVTSLPRCIAFLGWMLVLQ
jgi:hypothetical protein